MSARNGCMNSCTADGAPAGSRVGTPRLDHRAAERRICQSNPDAAVFVIFLPCWNEHAIEELSLADGETTWKNDCIQLNDNAKRSAGLLHRCSGCCGRLRCSRKKKMARPGSRGNSLHRQNRAARVSNCHCPATALAQPHDPPDKLNSLLLYVSPLHRAEPPTVVHFFSIFRLARRRNRV